MEDIEDESLTFEVVSDWIQINCDEFDHPIKRARTGRTQKINYWETPTIEEQISPATTSNGL
jgi:hypothetical protein